MSATLTLRWGLWAFPLACSAVPLARGLNRAGVQDRSRASDSEIAQRSVALLAMLNVRRLLMRRSRRS